MKHSWVLKACEDCNVNVWDFLKVVRHVWVSFVVSESVLPAGHYWPHTQLFKHSSQQVRCTRRKVASMVLGHLTMSTFLWSNNHNNNKNPGICLDWYKKTHTHHYTSAISLNIMWTPFHLTLHGALLIKLSCLEIYVSIWLWSKFVSKSQNRFSCYILHGHLYDLTHHNSLQSCLP